MVGGTAGPSFGTEVYQGATGGVTGKVAAADTIDHFTFYTGGDAGLGGNVRGVAGQLALQTELGGVAFEGPNHLFARGGFIGTSTFADAMHLDLGLRGGLLAAGRVFAGSRSIDLVAAPELMDFVNTRLENVAVFGDELLHLVRASACFEAFFALCLDTRQIVTHVDTGSERRPVHTSTLGVAFGSGLATGYVYER